MSFTTLIWVGLYLVALLGSVLHPLFPLFGYLLEYFQRPDLYWWGRDLPDLRWNFVIGLAAILSYLVHRQSLDKTQRVAMLPFWLMVGQAVNTSIVSLWAVDPELSWRWSTAYWKLVVTFVLFSGIARNAKALNYVIFFQIVGAAYWGWDALDARRVNTRLEGIGSADTQNSNTLAAHVLTVIPLTFILGALPGTWWLRLTALVCVPLIVNLLILANSRGATLGLLVTGIGALMLARTGVRRYVLAGAVVATLGLLTLADEQFVSRQQTMASAEDSAASSRLVLWQGALRMAADYPLGAGGRGFHLLSTIYAPEATDSGDGQGRSAHNTYIQVLAEWGVQGLLLFLSLIWCTFRLLATVKGERRVADRPYFIAFGLQLGLIGTLVAAFFSNRFFGESIYWLCGLSTALYSMTGRDASSENETPLEATAA